MGRSFDHLDKSFYSVTGEDGRTRWWKHIGPNGRYLCRRCGEEVPKGRTSYCSNQCYHEWRLVTDMQYVRSLLFARDRGVCRLCGVDTEQMLASQPARPNLWDMKAVATYQEVYATWAAECRARGFDAPKHYYYGFRSWWEADHIVAVVDGGEDLGLENFQTLCVPCHKQKTKELAERRARERSEREDAAQSDPQQLMLGVA